ncbi:nucleotide sugar dehydrogenase [Azospirillum sp. sgz301742]
MTHARRISVIGLGYVGLPVAVAFSRLGESVVAFDIDADRIAELKKGIDRTGEVGPGDLAGPLHFTVDSAQLAKANFHIITVPTPITDANQPDLAPLLSATRMVGQHLKRGDIVVYESTVYPGATEIVCVPLLEQVSGLSFGRDFAVGYSPERINPGDKEHRFETIVKVVAGSDPQTLEVVEAVYASVVQAGVHRAPCIAVAEAAKALENTQRDLNIALMNELSLICQRLGIDTHDVLAAAGTKWNFLRFTPGLVGGHCIGVDPYYLTYRAEQVGFHPEVILAGRRINDAMGVHIATTVAKHLFSSGVCHPQVTVLGLTFKEDIPDIRNTRVLDVVRELRSFGIGVGVHDSLADPELARHEYGIELQPLSALPPADAVVVAVQHKEYRDAGWALPQQLLKGGAGLVFDIRAALPRETTPEGITLWRL